MNSFEINWLNNLHDRVWEIKWEKNNFRVSLFSYKNRKEQWYFKLYFTRLWTDRKKLRCWDFPFLWFITDQWKMLFSWLYVPQEDRLNWIWYIMFETFLRMQEILDMENPETSKINKPLISIFLNKIWYFWRKQCWNEIMITWMTPNWTPIIKSLNWQNICRWKKWKQFLIVNNETTNKWPITTVWSRFQVKNHHLLSEFRDKVSTENQIRIYKWRLKKILSN